MNDCHHGGPWNTCPSYVCVEAYKAALESEDWFDILFMDTPSLEDMVKLLAT